MAGGWISKRKRTFSFSTSKSHDHPTCYDFQHKPLCHDVGPQRYSSPTTGKCRLLKVQSTEPRGMEVNVTCNTSKMIQTCVWLVEHIPESPGSFFAWFLRWLWFLCLIWFSLYDDSGAPVYTAHYKAYPMEFWGQLWAARSEREFSLRKVDLERRQLTLPATIKEEDDNVKDSVATHALYPRQLIVRDLKSQEWKPCTDSNTNIRINYVAISYRQTDFPDKVKLRKDVEEAVSELGYEAYWLDYLCTGEIQEEKNMDLYRIADVFRGAARTLIFIRETPDEPRSEGWLSWGDRVWTLPEALLSAYLMVKVGDGAVREISLRQVANFAYYENDEEMKIINGFSGKDQLQRLEKLTLLKEAIWRRSSGPNSSSTAIVPLPLTKPESEKTITVHETTTSPSNHSGSEFTAYPAERVYALMGFFEHRILPDLGETDLQALARLSMANDSDRIAERMVSMLPNDIKDQACWYSDQDLFGTSLWDIEPEVQAVGISQHGALVLDGARASTIRWKDFPRVAFDVKPSFKRGFCGLVPLMSFVCVITGGSLFAVNKAGGAIVLIIGIIGLVLGPRCVVYSDSGRILDARPWLIGARGVITAHEASIYCYGEDSTDPDNPRIIHSPTGSLLSRPDHGPMRRGDSSLSEDVAIQTHKASGNVYTLVDTCSDTIYYFTANKPPTVAVYTGKEGGLGRFILCSETCQINELHKEAVLRMPTYISRAMRSCGWLAIGGVFEKQNDWTIQPEGENLD